MRPLPALLLLAALASATGCATGRSTETLAAGVTVHTFRRGYANAHLVARGPDYFLVDSGYEANAPALADDLRRAGFDPAKLRAIVLTHGHADHAGGAGWFHRRYGTPVIAGAGDRPLLAAGHNDHLCPTGAIGRRRLATDQPATYSPYSADRFVDGELSLAELTGIPGRIVPVPGHTPGSLVVVLPDAGAALVGDLFRGALVGSSAEVHFFMCDLDGNRRDIGRLLDALAPGARLFFTGHFGPVTRAAVRDRFPPDHSQSESVPK